MDNKSPAGEPVTEQNLAEKLSDPAPGAPHPLPNPGEVAIITVLGVFSLCGTMMTVYSIFSLSNPKSLGMALWGLGPIAAGLGGAAMLWFRDRRKPVSALLTLAIVFWFMGTNILGFGGFGMFSPNDKSFLENVSFAVTLCGLPGGLLTLLSAAFYWQDRKRRRKQDSGLPQKQAAPKPAVVPRRETNLERAKEYVYRIEKLVARNKNLLSAAQEEALTSRLRVWQTHIQKLVRRLNAFEDNPVLRQDRREVPAAIARLETQLQAETDPDMRLEILQTLEGYRRQQKELDLLQQLMRRTELDLEESLAAVGTIHSQLHTLQAKDIDSRRVIRLSEDINEQSLRLDDLLQTVDEAYRQIDD